MRRGRGPTSWAHWPVRAPLVWCRIAARHSRLCPHRAWMCPLGPWCTARLRRGTSSRMQVRCWRRLPMPMRAHLRMCSLKSGTLLWVCTGLNRSRHSGHPPTLAHLGPGCGHSSLITVLVGGFDAQAPGFFWVAGQGGYGIQTAPAMGQACAGLMLDGALSQNLLAAGLTPAMLSPQRLWAQPAGQPA
jgi:hypothetical protein